MARDFHVIPATSEPAEAMFSVAREILTKRRSAMAANTMNRVMCCKNWIGIPEYTPAELEHAQLLHPCVQAQKTDGDFEEIGV